MIHADCESLRPSRGRHGRRYAAPPRRGISTLWLILVLPVLVILLALVVEIGNLWLARLELEAAMEAAALAAVKQWGSNPSNTLNARLIGVEYAKTNSVRGQPVIIGTNAGSGPFGNNLCGSTPGPATLVFGALTQLEPDETFDARGTISPGCAVADVLLDATATTGDLSQMSTWGINFKNNAGPTDDNLRIVEVIYDLRAGGDSDASFALNDDEIKPVISTVGANSSSRYKYGCPEGLYYQAETSGLDTSTVGSRTTIAPGIFQWKNSQVTFRWNRTTPGRLSISFSAKTGDSGFNVGDRIRFGVPVSRLGPGEGNVTGDAVGQNRVQVTTIVASGTTIQFTLVSTFVDTTYGNCLVGATPPPEIDPALPANYPLLSGPSPQPYVIPIPASPTTPLADGQSVVAAGLSGTGGIPFAVRAQCFQSVPTVMQRLFGLPLGTFQVGAKATAMYDCGSGHPRLIHVEDFFCP